jgi:hypothetical protein
MTSNNDNSVNDLNALALAAKKKIPPRSCKDILKDIEKVISHDSKTPHVLGRPYKVAVITKEGPAVYDFTTVTRGLAQRLQDLKDDQYSLYTKHRTIGNPHPGGYGSWDGHIQKYNEQVQVLKQLLKEFRKQCLNTKRTPEEEKALNELLDLADRAVNTRPPQKPDAVLERERRQREGKEPNPTPGPAPSQNPNPSSNPGISIPSIDVTPLQWIIPILNILFGDPAKAQSNTDQCVANSSTNTKPISNDVKEKLNVMYEKIKGISSDKTDLDIARIALKTGVDPKIVEIMITHSGKQTGSESVQKEYAAKIVQDAQKSQESATIKANAVTSQMQLV